MELHEFKLYDNKSFSDICKEVVINSEHKKDQIDVLVSDLKILIKTVNDAMMIVPLISKYLEVGVRNDEQLVKLLAVVQRIMSKGTEDSNGDSLLLTDEEKENLLNTVKDMKVEVKPLKPVVPAKPVE